MTEYSAYVIRAQNGAKWHPGLPGTPAPVEHIAVQIVDDVETPMPNALIFVLRRRDGRCLWRGHADQHGRFVPSGLLYGEEYVMVAIDPDNTFASVAAGPLRARAENV